MDALAVSSTTLDQEALLINTPPEDRYALGLTPYGTPSADGFRPSTGYEVAPPISNGPNPSTQLDCVNTEC
jgi:hypothetical protein